jgi:integrase
VRVRQEVPSAADGEGAAVLSGAAALELFLVGCRARGLSIVTVDWYGRLLERFLRGRRELPLDVGEVEEFLGLPGASQGTRHAYFRALRVFYGWLERRGLVGSNPLRLVTPPRVRRSPPMGLERGEVRRVMAAALCRRDKVMLSLLLDTGIRLGELMSMRWEWVGEDTFWVSGKTGKREIPLSEWMRFALVGVELPWRSARGGSLTAKGMYLAVRRCLQRAGVRKGGPHLLRHTFARLYICAGGDQFSLQRILGHSDVRTTSIYVALEMRDVVAQHRRYSPLVGLLEEAAG